MAAYYPRRVARFADLQKAYPGFETYDDFEEDRIESVAITKSRGKGAPKKKRTAAGKWGQSKREGKRMKRDGKDGMLTFCEMQNPRSLARRRGRRCVEGGLFCLETYSTRTKATAGACNNIHGCTGCKKDRALGLLQREAFYGVLPGGYTATEKLTLYKNSNFQPSHQIDESCVVQYWFCRTAQYLSAVVFCPTRQDRISLKRRISKITRTKNISSVDKKQFIMKDFAISHR